MLLFIYLNESSCIRIFFLNYFFSCLVSSWKWSNLEQIKHKIQKKISVKNFFNQLENIRISLNKPDCSNIFKKDLIVTFYVLNNVFSYTLAVFVFFLQEYFYIYLAPFFPFFLFVFQKDVGFFHVLLFGVFICVFNNIYLPFSYTQKQIYKKNYTLVYELYKYYGNNISYVTNM